MGLRIDVHPALLKKYFKTFTSEECLIFNSIQTADMAKFKSS